MYPKPKNKEQEEYYRRTEYEAEKKGLIEFHKKMNYPQDSLNMFLVNSLKTLGFEKELKEDGLL